MNSALYFINHSGKSKYCYISEDLSYLGFFSHSCSECGRDIPVAKYNNENHQLLIDGGNEYPDLLQFCGAGDRITIISKKAIDLFEKNGITGFSVDSKVNLFKKKRNKIISVDDDSTYYLINITGIVDYDYKSMFLKKKRFCPKCGKFELNRQRLYPVYFNVSTWDGHDLCSLSTFPGRKVCTEKVVNIVKRNGLTGFDFEKVKTV